MKVLIWFGCLFASSLIQVLLSTAGIRLGGIPTAVLVGFFMWLATALCRKLCPKKETPESKKEPAGKPCPNCGRHISRAATACPHCGYTTSTPAQPSTPKYNERPCPMCGEKIPAGFSSCSYCGYSPKQSEPIGQTRPNDPASLNQPLGHKITSTPIPAQIPVATPPIRTLSNQQLSTHETIPIVSTPRKIRFCRHCGFELIEHSNFCSRCGNKIEKYREMQSASHIGKNSGDKHPMYGKHHTDEARKIIGQKSREMWSDPEFRKQHHDIMSQLFTGDGNPFYGKHHTQDTKDRISSSRKGKYCGEENHQFGKPISSEAKEKMRQKKKRPVQQIDLNTGDVIKTWPSIKIAQNTLGIGHISEVCRPNSRQNRQVGLDGDTLLMLKSNVQHRSRRPVHFALSSGFVFPLKVFPLFSL